MRLLVNLMREASARTRLVIATHSDRLIRFLEPKELMVFDIDENGETSAAYADSFDPERWLSKYKLGEL
jgi:predicted ATPase